MNNCIHIHKDISFFRAIQIKGKIVNMDCVVQRTKYSLIMLKIK